MAELKPCPFCNGAAEFDFAVIDVKHEGVTVFDKVRCSRCKAQTNIYRTKDDAANAWNTRVSGKEN